jgi:hypothetical protein
MLQRVKNMSINNDLEAILKLDQQTAAQHEDIRTQFSVLQQRIKNGESTGDPIKDFVLVYYGVHEETEKIIRGIFQKTEQAIGKPILTIYKQEHMNGCTGMGNPDSISPYHFSIETTYRLGILGQPLRPDTASQLLIFPTGKQAIKRDYGMWKLHEGDIAISTWEFHYLGNKVERRMGHTDPNHLDYHHGLSIFIGDEVEQYFRNPHGDLSLELEEFKAQIHGKWIDPSYAEVLHLLGQKVPEEFEVKLEERTTREKQEVIDALLNNTGVSEESEVRSIKKRLERALELGMHTEDRTIPLKYPGSNLHIPTYIKDMCKTYKVDIPT